MVREKASIFTRFINYIKAFDINNDKENYSLFFGQITAFLIFAKELVSFFVVEESEVKFSYYFLAAAIVLLLFLITFTLIANDIVKKTKFMKILIIIYPYIIATIGNLIIYVYVNFASQVFSYFIAIITLSFIQIYPRVRRLSLFIYSFVLFFVINYLFHGFTGEFFKYFSMSFMITAVSYLIALIHYQNFYARERALNILNRKSEEQKRTYDKLEKTYQDLLISHNITEKMLNITQDILTNDRLEDVLQRVLDEAINIIPKSQAGSILISRGDRMEYVASKGYKLETLKKIHLTFEDLFQSTLDNKYEATIIQNLETFDKVHLSDQKLNSFIENDVHLAKSCLTCSFKFDGEFFGSINLDNFEELDIFDNADKYFIQQLAREIEIIISIHKLYEQAIRPTKIDELTKAYTRKYGIQLLERTIRQNENIVYSICFIDINGLKNINDDYGHDTGDKYLRSFADGVKQSKIKENIFSRIGGDEFLLVFKGLDKNSALEELNKIRNYFEIYPFNVNKKNKVIEFAAGISTYPEDNTDISKLVKLADERMYFDKRK